MILSYKERPPRMIKYRDYKKFSNEHFRNSLNENLANYTESHNSRFEEIVLNLLSSQASFKKRMVTENQRVFMNKKIHKAIVVRSKPRNKFLREKMQLADKHIINKETTS